MTVKPHKFWQTVFALYAKHGLAVITDRKVNDDGFVYSNGVVCLNDDYRANDPLIAFHDLCHHLIAPAERKMLPNWGLGPYPNYDDGAVMVVTPEESVFEECLATTLHEYMVTALFGAAAREYVNKCLGSGEDPTSEEVNTLVAKGFLVRKGDDDVINPALIAL